MVGQSAVILVAGWRAAFFLLNHTRAPLRSDLSTLVSPMSQLFGVALRGTGSCLPARVVPNDEFTDTLNLDTTDEWIRTRTGIRERRFADLGETSSSLGSAAARRAIESAALAATDI